MDNNESKRFVKNASWIMVGRIFQLFLTFISTTIVTRYLGPAEFGRLTYVYSYVQLFIPLCTLGLNDIIVKELVEDKNKNSITIGTIATIRIIASLFSMLCSIGLVSLLNNSPIYRTIAILQSFSLLFQSFDCIMYFYQAKLLSYKTGIIHAVSYIITALFRVTCVITKQSIYCFAFAYSLDFIVVAILFVSIYLKDQNKFKFSFSEAHKLLKKSMPYTISGIMIVLYGKVTDTLLLGKMVDDTAVGYYGAATTLCNAWPFILTAIIDSANPIIIKLHNNKELFNKRMKQLYASVFYVGLFVAIMITIFSNLIINILYGNEFAQAATPLRIVCWSTIFAYIGVARTVWMQCEEKTKYETIISVIGTILNIALNYILIKRFGIIGASITILITQFVTNFLVLFIFKDTRENAKLILNAIILKDVFK